MIGYENCLCTDSVSLCVSEKLSRNVAIIVLKHTRCIFCKVSRIPKAQESMRQSITKDLSQSVKTGNRFFLSRRIFNWRLWHRNFMRRYKKHISISQMCACTARTGKLRNFIIQYVTKNVCLLTWWAKSSGFPWSPWAEPSPPSPSSWPCCGWSGRHTTGQSSRSPEWIKLFI